MNKPNIVDFSSKWIRQQRGKKNLLDPLKPYLYLHEKERISNGKIEDVLTVFISNKECSFTCLMCDLWKNTTDKIAPHGAIANQIRIAINELPQAAHIKLYNSGSFFDPNSIPLSEYEEIASLLVGYKTVIVENHPLLTNQKILRFAKLIQPAKLQIAIGLETTNPEVLALLNKKMTLKTYQSAMEFLNRNGIGSRSFILLRPPFLSEEEGVYWAKKSIDFAFDAGSEYAIVIPTRGGNGAMEKLQELGKYEPPQLSSLENVLDYGVNLNKGIVQADTWDLQIFSNCPKCIDKRKERIEKINIYQEIIPDVHCSCI